MIKCTICPRNCDIDRNEKVGICGTNNKIKIARASAHFWEEPCISGYGGSGAVFFSGCNMKCVYCQNHEISAGCFGKEITADQLRKIYFDLIDTGVHNINLVTPTHFANLISPTLCDLPVPIVWNTSGYEKTQTLKTLEGKVQIYLPDFKYMSQSLAKKYSLAPDYPEVAKEAIKEMYRQVGAAKLDSNGIMQSGMIIRHLMLPGQLENTLDIVDWVSKNFGDNVIFSLMSQFTPNASCKAPELQNPITQSEYEKAVDYLYLCGMNNAYVQDFSSASSDFTPPFDLTGVV